MTVPVNLNLTLNSIYVDFVAQSVTANFSFSKLGGNQVAKLEMDTDFTANQLGNLQNQMESLFQKWVSRQVS